MPYILLYYVTSQKSYIHFEGRGKMKEFDLHWEGQLTVGNVGKVADLLLQLLRGKRYTFVATNEIFGIQPEIRTGQTLEGEKPIRVFYDTRHMPPRFAGLAVGDSTGVWDFITDLTEDKYDPKGKNPYFVFEGNKVTVVFRAPAGNLLCRVVVVESD